MPNWLSISLIGCRIEPAGTLTCGTAAANMTVMGAVGSPALLPILSLYSHCFCGYTEFGTLPRLIHLCSGMGGRYARAA